MTTGAGTKTAPLAGANSEATPTDVAAFLRERRASIVAEASLALARAHRPHYSQDASNEAKLDRLLDVIVESIASRDLHPVLRYIDSIADDRFLAGFGLGEVQTAFNVLEEATWRRIVSEVPASDVGSTLAVVTAVLGAGKDALARRYVANATGTHVATVDLSRLFGGTGS